MPAAIIGPVAFDDTGLRPLVGRDQALTRLVEATGLFTADGPAAPTGGLVVLSGDAGIGKTRLLSELVGRAHRHSVRLLIGHCLGEAGSMLPYLPFTEMLTRMLAEEGEALAGLVAANPGIGRLLPTLSGEEVGEAVRVGGADQGSVFEGVHSGLEQLSRLGPLLVVVEDVHWSDQSSRELLTLLLTRGFTGPVALVVSLRSDDLHRRHPLRTSLTLWSRLPRVTRIDLGPLEPGPMRALVRGVDAGIDARSLASVVERAEGNAFFAEELAAAARLGHGAAADDLSRLLLVRLEQLDDAAQRVVRIASAAGRRVSHPLLQRVVQSQEPSLDPSLDGSLRQAVERHVLVADEHGYAFRHALLGETVYDDLLPGERVRIHQAYARMLAAEPELAPAAELARHAGLAGDRDLAISASERAGAEAIALGGPNEALSHLEKALSLNPGDPRTVVRITLAAAAAAGASGHLTKAVALLEDRLAQDQDASECRAELLIELALAARLTELRFDGLAITAEALQLVGDDDSGLRARALAARAQAYSDRGRIPDAMKTGRDAVAMADRLGMTELGAEVWTLLARAGERVGDLDASRQSLEKVIAEATASGPQFRAIHHLGGLHHRAGRLQEALSTYLRGVEEAQRMGLGWSPYAFDCRVLAIVAAYESGQWDLALQIADLTGEDPPPTARALLQGAALYVVAGRGNPSLARDFADGELRRFWDDDGMLTVLDASARIDLAGDAGDLATARAVHAEAIGFLRHLWETGHVRAEIRMNSLLLGQLARRARVAPAAERTTLLDHGRRLAWDADAVWADAGSLGDDGPESQAWQARAVAEFARLRWLCAADSDVDPAALQRLWRNAEDAFRRYGHPFEVARSQLGLIEVLAATGRHDLARDTAEEVRATAQTLGAAPVLADLAALLGEDAAASTPTAPRQSLTTREQEILAELARGRSNRQIGEKLFISTKTVSVHVSNLMAKLEASSRGEAVAVARDRGLLPSP